MTHRIRSEGLDRETPAGDGDAGHGNGHGHGSDSDDTAAVEAVCRETLARIDRMLNSVRGSLLPARQLEDIERLRETARWQSRDGRVERLRRIESLVYLIVAFGPLRARD